MLSGEQGKNQKGFSMIEIIIGIALLGIMSAALVPSFASITRKTKLKADIQSVVTFQNMIDMYTADHDGKLPGNPASDVNPGLKDETEVGESVYTDLTKAGYIAAKDLDENKLKVQTKDVSLEYNATQEQVNLVIASSADQKTKDIVEDLSDREKEWVSVVKSQGQ